MSLNPSVDISYEIDQLVMNKKVRSTQTRYYPGGNGINVARSLKELKLPCRCYNIIGGEIGNLLLHLLGNEFADSHHHFCVDGETVKYGAAAVWVTVTVFVIPPPVIVIVATLVFALLFA